ncbi:MAG TPA: HAD family hydrolase, partial [Solirubrobacterales bacterium]|nr:HAD family hydrolase [Solirubrobacterales bacterium]
GGMEALLAIVADCIVLSRLFAPRGERARVVYCFASVVGTVASGRQRRRRRRGKTLLFVKRDEHPVGILAAADTLRPEIPEALQSLRELEVHHLRLLTGDNERLAATVAGQLGVDYRANLLAEDKIAVVRELQGRWCRTSSRVDGVESAVRVPGQSPGNGSVR